MRITIFSENFKGAKRDKVLEAYPEGMENCLKSFISEKHDVTVILHSDEDDGSALTEEVLENTDVLVWWGHCYHEEVSDEVADRVVSFVNRGMSMLALHSSHKSKPLMRLLGTTADLSWREIGEHERLWFINPNHPIAEGIEVSNILIPHEEMYGEPFAIPDPDELLLLGWFRGGEVMRSGCLWRRSQGKLFFLQPGHETNPTYKIPEMQRLILNIIDYIKPTAPLRKPFRSPNIPEPQEKF